MQPGDVRLNARDIGDRATPMVHVRNDSSKRILIKAKAERFAWYRTGLGFVKRKTRKDGCRIDNHPCATHVRTYNGQLCEMCPFPFVLIYTDMCSTIGRHTQEIALETAILLLSVSSE